MTRWSLFLQTLSLLHHFLGLYYQRKEANNMKPMMNATNFGVETMSLSSLAALSMGQGTIGDIPQQGDFTMISWLKDEEAAVFLGGP